ncbi:MAG: glycosyltransferase family protein [Nitrospirae bacterium]|nr:glycosyltransferase family protein [Magnetococcales bacterium]
MVCGNEVIWIEVSALNTQRRFAEALEKMAPAFDQGNPGIIPWKLRGQALYGLGRWAEAVGAFAKVLQWVPDDGESYEHLAKTLLAMDRHDQALLTVERGLMLNDGNQALLSLRFVLLWRVGNRDAALRLAHQHLQDHPGDGSMWHERGTVFLEQGADREALFDLDRACHLLPDHSRVWGNRATALWRLGRYREALDDLNRAVELDPNNASAQHHRALLWLFLGDFTLGFSAYEWRWSDPAHLAQRPSLSIPFWQGEVMTAATLLVFPEQGYGDTIHFMRFLPRARRRVAKVIFWCSGPLAPLLRHAPGVDLLCDGEHPPPPCDRCVSLMSLPGVLQQTQEEIPGVSDYLPEFAWAKPFRTTAAGLRVGLVWRGRPTHRNDHNRSLRFTWFEPFLDWDFITWTCLQADGREEVAKNPHWLKRMDCPDLVDFAATARIVQTLDLVITVDTAVAHLAGALGCPVWVLLPFVPDWRWGPEGETTVWYPSMRLFRQPSLGDWESVRKQVQMELNKNCFNDRH